jgi:hypothetical protein
MTPADSSCQLRPTAAEQRPVTPNRQMIDTDR